MLGNFYRGLAYGVATTPRLTRGVFRARSSDSRPLLRSISPLHSDWQRELDLGVRGQCRWTEMQSLRLANTCWTLELEYRAQSKQVNRAYEEAIEWATVEVGMLQKRVSYAEDLALLAEDRSRKLLQQRERSLKELLVLKGSRRWRNYRPTLPPLSSMPTRQSLRLPN